MHSQHQWAFSNERTELLNVGNQHGLDINTDILTEKVTEIGQRFHIGKQLVSGQGITSFPRLFVNGSPLKFDLDKDINLVLASHAP